jgi:5-keto-L-gluconate epimerase
MSMKLAAHLPMPEARLRPADFLEGLREDFSRLSALSYNGIELCIRDPAQLDLVVLTSALKHHRLSVAAIETDLMYRQEGLSLISPDHDIWERAVKRLKDCIDAAAVLDAVVVLGAICGRVENGLESHRALEWLRTAIVESSDYATPKGVRLAIEPLNRYETDLLPTAAAAVKLIRSTGVGNVGVAFDTFHANIEERSLEESLRRCGPLLYHVHIADSNRRAPGDGHIDFQSIFSVLRDMRYDGWCSVEADPKPDLETSALRAATHVRRLLEELDSRG